MKCRLHRLDLPKALRARFEIEPIFHTDTIQRAIHKEGQDPSKFENLAQYQLEQLFKERKVSVHNPRYLELCCGTGDFLSQLASKDREAFYLGVDYAPPVIDRCLVKAEALNLSNILFYPGRIEDFFQHDFAGHFFDGIFINFPDPWPKKKHHKRRIVRQEIIQHVLPALKPGKCLYTATDLIELHREHFEVLETFSSIKSLYAIENTEKPHPAYNTVSVYEQKGLTYERNIYYTCHQKI